MKIVKISSSAGSYCSSDVKSAYKNLRDKIEKNFKEKIDEKLTVEIFDIENGQINLGSNLPNQKS